MSHQEQVPSWWPYLSGCLATTEAADPGLHLGSTAFGREGKSANTGQLLPFGDECGRAKVASRGACCLQQAGCFPWSGGCHPRGQEPKHWGLTWEHHHSTHHHQYWRCRTPIHANPGDRHCQYWSVQPQSVTTQGIDNIIPAEPTISSAETNLPVAAEVLPQKDAAVPVTKRVNGTPRDLINPQAVSPAMAENQIIPTIMLRDEPASPTPSDQVGGERPCTLTVTNSIGRLNLEATGVTPGNTEIASVERMTFGNPHMVASLLGLSKEGSHKGTAVDELAERDLAREWPWRCHPP